MSIALQEAKPRGKHGSATGGPAAEHPGLWSVVQRARPARLIYPGGPDYRSLIVDYEVNGWGVEVVVPMRDVVPGDLDERDVTMGILDDYLAMTAEHVRLVGRVQEWDGATSGARGVLAAGPGVPVRAYTIAAWLLSLNSDD